jgi:hypothetical protein
VAFLWYESKAFVLVDLEELPDDVHPFAGLRSAGAGHRHPRRHQELDGAWPAGVR